MFAFLRRFGTVAGLLALSQAVNALSLALMPLLLDPAWADSFALGLQVGTAAYGGVVLGVVYNIAIGRPDFRRWKRAAVLAGIFSIALGAITIGGTVALGRGGDSIPLEGILVISVFAVGGAGLAVGGTGGVREACLNNPARLTMVNVAPAFALLFGLLATTWLHLSPVLAAALWAVAAVGQIPWIWRRRAGAEVEPVEGALPEPKSSGTRTSSGSAGGHAVSLAVGVIASTIIPTLYVTALTQLPAGSTALAFVIVRIATSIVGIGVNSLLLVRYNWKSNSRDIRGLVTILTAAAAATTALSVAFAFTWPRTVALGVLVLGWVILLVCAAVSLRETNARRLSGSIAAKVAIDVSLSVLGCVFLFMFPSLDAYFGLLVLSQAITMLVTSAFFRFRWATAFAVVALTCAVLWVFMPKM